MWLFMVRVVIFLFNLVMMLEFLWFMIRGVVVFYFLCLMCRFEWYMFVVVICMCIFLVWGGVRLMLMNLMGDCGLWKIIVFMIFFGWRGDVYDVRRDGEFMVFDKMVK